MPVFYFQASLCERERSVGQRPSLCESDCKDKNFYCYTPNKSEIIFIVLSGQSYAVATCQNLKTFRLLESGCKSTGLCDTSQI